MSRRDQELRLALFRCFFTREKPLICWVRTHKNGRLTPGIASYRFADNNAATSEWLEKRFQHVVASLFSGRSHQSESLTARPWRLDERSQESLSGKRSRVWGEEGGERKPNLLSGWVGWHLFGCCVFAILRLMRNLEQRGCRLTYRVVSVGKPQF